MKEPGLTFLFEATGELAAPVEIGPTPAGLARVVPILAGGPFAGPRLRGRVLAGHDWQTTRNDGVTIVDAHYLLETDDGVLLECRNHGMRHGPPEVMQRLAAGEAVDPDSYYFRAAPRFTAPAGRYDWLNRSLFLCTGARFAKSVTVRFYEVG
ncbi:DUF3237 domain-containing protein [Novosphingobium piscinae]|uniref:UPF0311 protein H7F53_14245 n=1 Tax=Novosphingobium piscinae TaxID=1507448 RepID=A0A7X1G0D0_9SPHN|nr:DUF3237 domain-containing protein [Novosphingobium piscinae]MBC2670311.1 DUF3237 domain-containing protein [Novosphingobium piscinae]